MKKLSIIFLLFALIIGSNSFSQSVWVGGSTGSWNTASNWSPAAVPGATDLVVFGGDGIGAVPTNGAITVTNVPAGVTQLNGIIVNWSDLGGGSFNGTAVTLQGTADGTSTIEILFDGSVDYGGLENTVQINAVPVAAATNACQLNLDFAGARINLHMLPRTRLQIMGIDGASAVNTMGILRVPLYASCDDNNTLKGLYLDADGTGHAELIQQTTNNNNGVPIYGFVNWNLSTISGGGTASSAHFIASPITTDGTVSSKGLICRKENSLCVFDGDYIRYYDPAASWTPWYGTVNCYSGTLDFLTAERGKGFEVFASNSDKYFFGLLNNAPRASHIILPVGNLQTNGFTLLGNPFPSGVNFYSQGGSNILGWTWGSNVQKIVWYWDPAVSGGNGGYRFYNWGSGTSDGFGGTPSFVPRGQGFFVRHTSSAGPNHNIEVWNDARTWATSSNIKSNPVEVNTLKLQVLNMDKNYLADALVAYFAEGATLNYQDMDVEKLFNDLACNQIYSVTTDNFNVVGKALPLKSGTTTMPVYLKVNENGNYQINADNISSFGEHAGIILVDRKSNTTQDLKTNPVYPFVASSNDDQHRFDVLFSDVLNGVPTLSNGTFNIYSTGKTIYIQDNNNLNSNLVVTIYDMIGKQIIQENVSLNGSIATINTNVTSGYYVVSVKSDKSMNTQKLFIQ